MKYVLCFTNNVGNKEFRDYLVFNTAAELRKEKGEMQEKHCARMYQVNDEWRDGKSHDEVASIVLFDEVMNIKQKDFLRRLKEYPALQDQLREFLEDFNSDVVATD